MQEVTPKVVPIAVNILTINCNISFQVSFFITYFLLSKINPQTGDSKGSVPRGIFEENVTRGLTLLGHCPEGTCTLGDRPHGARLIFVIIY